MKLNLLHALDALLLLAATAFAWAVGQAWLAVPVLMVGFLAVRHASNRSPDTAQEKAEGRQRTYAQFQKDLNDPTGASGISIFPD